MEGKQGMEELAMEGKGCGDGESIYLPLWRSGKRQEFSWKRIEKITQMFDKRELEEEWTEA